MKTMATVYSMLFCSRISSLLSSFFTGTDCTKKKCQKHNGIYWNILKQLLISSCFLWLSPLLMSHFLSLSPYKCNNLKLRDDYCCGCLATGIWDLEIWNLRLQTHLCCGLNFTICSWEEQICTWDSWFLNNFPPLAKVTSNAHQNMINWV